MTFSFPGMFQRDEWLSEMLGLESFNLIIDDVFRDRLRSKALESAEMISVVSRECFVQAKVDVTDFPTLHFLEELGFRLIDTSVTFEKNTVEDPGACESHFSRFAEPEDEESAVSLGSRSMVYTRFHLDPLLGKAIADVIKGEWVRSYFKGKRGDHLVLAEYDGRVVGFLQIIAPDKTNWIIDLIAVDPEYRGRGIASDMIAFAESKLTGFGRIVVGTQVANIPSIRLYEKLGFRLYRSRYILHFHGPKSEAL